MAEQKQSSEDGISEGRETFDMDVDRMINEGLGGGYVKKQNGLVTESTTDTMEADEP